MKPDQLESRLFKLQKASFRAIPYMPRQSKFRTWAYKAIAETLPAVHFLKLEKRLQKFHGKDY